ncbi:hypothetical protein PG997_001485 [Apiospora hydei]|uniref:Uncharacterized protein n=1 Tax=Apiospora hydei TaxID=1337664 RepID=A0ABR1XDR6_9PEZI
MDSLIQGYKQDALRRGKDQLILVLFEYRAEWNWMSRHFSGVARHFASWLDVRDLGKAVNPKKALPGLRDTLRVLGYRWPEIALPGCWAICPLQRGGGHNAGDDAAMTLAALEGLLSPVLREFLAQNQDMRSIMACTALSPRKADFAATFEPAEHAQLPPLLERLHESREISMATLPDILALTVQGTGARTVPVAKGGRERLGGICDGTRLGAIYRDMPRGGNREYKAEGPQA